MIDNLRELWSRASLVQRVMLLGAGAGCLVAAVLLIRWASEPEMALLYRGLTPEDAAAVVDRLREDKVPFELSSGGTTVLVAAGQRDALRLTMASAGLPSGGSKGYSLLDSEGIGVSPERQRINYFRAIEGELERTIETIQGVGRARVHVVRPPRAVFAADSRDAKASVMIAMNGGLRLTATQVAAITHLIAGAVEGLDQDRVVVTDSRGELLTSRGGDASAVRADSIFEYTARIERYHAENIEGMLQAVLGPHRATVKVCAEIDPSSIRETHETYDPAGKVVRKEMEKTRSTSGGGGGNNAPGGTSEEGTMETEYALSKTIKTLDEPPGQVKSLSISAFVDLSGLPTPGGRPPLTVQIVEEAIRNAVGGQRVASLTVVDHPFAEAASPEPEPSTQDLLTSPSFLLEMGKRVSLGVLVLGVLTVLMVTRRKGGRGDVSVQQLGGRGQGQAALAGGSGALLPGQSAEDATAEALREGISRALRDNPDQVKRLFHSWMETEQKGS